MPRRARRSPIGNTPRTLDHPEHVLPLPEEIARAFPVPGPSPVPIDEVRGNQPSPVDVDEIESEELPHYDWGNTVVSNEPMQQEAPAEVSFADDFMTAIQYIRALRYQHYGGTEELTPALLVMLLAEMREQRFLLNALLKQEQETPL